MTSDKNLIVTLNDNVEYTLINKMDFNDKRYVYLVALDNYNNFVIGELDGDTITPVKDHDLLCQLTVQFDQINEKEA